MESGLSAMLAEIVAMEERKQALLEELNELDQRLFKAKSKWVRAITLAATLTLIITLPMQAGVSLRCKYARPCPLIQC